MEAEGRINGMYNGTAHVKYTSQYSMLRNLYAGSSHDPEAAGWVSSPGQQVGPGLFQAVGHLSPAQTQTWDQLTQQEPQQLHGGLEHLSKGYSAQKTWWSRKS